MFNRNFVLDNISYPYIIRKVPLGSWRETDWQYLFFGQPMKNITNFHVSVNAIKAGVKLYSVWSVCHLIPTLPLRQESGPGMYDYQFENSVRKIRTQLIHNFIKIIQKISKWTNVPKIQRFSNLPNLQTRPMLKFWGYTTRKSPV